MSEPTFITLEQVHYLHSESLKRFGGSEGIRDQGQIESALGSAQNTWFYGGNEFDVAASYAFHLAESQAYLDGNKRTAVAAAIAFLRINGMPLIVDDGTLYDAMIAIAEKRMDKKGLAEVFRTLTEKNSK